MNEPQDFDFLIPEERQRGPLREAIDKVYLADEAEMIRPLLAEAQLDPDAASRVDRRARSLVSSVRARKADQGVLEAFMQEYDLSTEEGVVLMCLAEALLRIPDDETAEKLIADKLGEADWESHLGRSASVLVNASTWGLMLTGKLVQLSSKTQNNFRTALGRLMNRSGEPMVRAAIRQAMRIMGHQYVMGRSIDEALERSLEKKNRLYRYSFDMLGEAALAEEDAQAYMDAYRQAIGAIGASQRPEDVFAAPSISVKLSALHSRFELSQRERVMRELTPRLLELAQLAMANQMALTVDTEEADRFMLTLDVFEAVLKNRSLAGWNGLGLALQTYQKRAWPAIDWLADLSAQSGQRIPVRLVKGAYWDTEVKEAQVEGLAGYPVFTRKANTDVSYIACAKRVLARRQAFYPQFATHNAHTIAIVTELAGDRLDYEFQRLHGMGEDLYGVVMKEQGFHHACRVYAPVGSHEDLLPYLVRRLLENGANTSFVNRIVDEKLPVEEVAEDPIRKVASTEPASHPAIPLPRFLYGPERVNSAGINLSGESDIEKLAVEMQRFAQTRWDVEPILAVSVAKQAAATVVANVNPARPADIIGQLRTTAERELNQAIESAVSFSQGWDGTPAVERAAMLDNTADLMEEHFAELMALCIREAGKTVHDSVSEIREAVDFLRYYAVQAREHFAEPIVLPGPTGERNELSLHGRGVFACISPWNFPLAIFTGQVSAALVAGNAVLAKPAEQTPAIAALAVKLLHQAGVPREALQLLPGGGVEVGARLTADSRIDGVAFTGSTETARAINRSLAARDAPLAALIAETGGQNTMLVDSSALPQQVVVDVISSAFHSAGQRCSALRVLYVQTDVAEEIMDLLAGAMREIVVGDPRQLVTDVGPVIDEDALAGLQAHVERMEKEARLIARTPLPRRFAGYFLAPCAFEVDSIGRLEREVFGPVLHVIRYRARDLDRVIDEINATGYGLTLGVHSRIDRTQNHVARRVRAGNCYVNRNMIGAVVGVQPFGGERLSGTGPKAGGPHYMFRFATERTLTVNTAAVGGNAALLEMES
ncbi:MAG: bifunctional proline dehydrogenase/L-glutamate gamma-semialdehyde dehydrogenase PutA [Xanthomonadales bacterium]|nr:bifunctional proline dehydrogenase/L-glutamate gamma-semialdehyde dehydrogenase PutA [Xanthomonadales bacterium]